jgi:hypothetical protein
MITLRTATTLAALLAAGAAHATTWYVSGHLDPLNGGNPLDPRLAAAFADGSPFIGSFTFDAGAAAVPMIPGQRTDFVTDAAHGGATSLQFSNASYATTSSRIIEGYLFNGEQLSLNANDTPAGGTPVAGLNLVGLDLLSIAHYGPQDAPASEKWPWYQPGQMPNALPDLGALPAGTVAELNLSFYDPVAGSYASRIGVIDGLSTTPFALPVPEPSRVLLLAGGLLLVGWRQRRVLSR